MATFVHVSNDVKRERDVYVSLSADTTLTAADSGKIFKLDEVGEVITLPAVSDGVNFKFVCETTTGTSDWTIINGADVMYGSAEVAGAIVACSAQDVITLVVAKFLPGDWVELSSDGSVWNVKGEVVTAAGCTFTT